MSGTCGRTQGGIKSERIPGETTREREGEVRLIDVAPCNRLLQLSERFLVRAGRKLRIERPERSNALGTLYQHGGHGLGGDDLRFLEPAEPH